MATYLIGYDINKEGAAYASANERLTTAIKRTFSPWWHHLESTWIVVTSDSAKNIRDQLRQELDGNDELLVVKLSGEAAWHGFDDKGSGWLKNNL